MVILIGLSEAKLLVITGLCSQLLIKFVVMIA